MLNRLRFLVSQKGSREHFLVATAMHREKILSHMVVDWYSPQGSFGRLLKNSPSRVLTRALSVRAEGIPDDLVTPLNMLGLKDRIRCNLWKHFGRRAEATLKGDIQFATAVSRLKLPSHNAFFGYSYSSLEALRAEKARGNFCVLDQIDPGEKEHEIIKNESIRWSGYVSHRDEEIPRLVYERLHEEWNLADLIIVNSEWSLQCNLEKGAPREKIVVVPLAYESGKTILNPQNTMDNAPSKASEIVSILWVGRVTLQKGIQYLVEAARLLQDQPVRFLIAGDVRISASAIKGAPSNIRWLGKVSHAEKQELLRSSTAFVLPTLSDGFAMTQLEAMSSGLPVIVTTNCGCVVEDGKNGFIIPPKDPVALAGAIKKFIDDPYIKEKMSNNCLEVSGKYTIEEYRKNLMKAFDSFV